MGRFFYTSLLLLAALSLASAGDLIVKTYPDGMRDDNIARLYQDKISTISFFLFSSDDKPIEMEDVKLSIELPEGMDIISYGFSECCLSALNPTKKYYDMEKTMNGNSCLWKLNCENQAVKRKFAPVNDEVYGNYHFYVYLEPKLKMNLAEFILKWEFQGGGISGVNGTMKVRLLPGPKNRKNPKRFIGWTGMGIDSDVKDEKELDNLLDIAKECGITGIVTHQTNEKIRKVNERIREKGFTLVMEPAGSNPIWSILRATLPEEEYPKDEENYQVDLRNIRVRKKADMLANPNPPMFIHAILWCPTALATPGSEIFEKTVAALKKSYAEGFRIFYDDAEMEFCSSCFCSHCRKSFARYIKTDEKETLNVAPLDLICKYPVEWYKFRCWQVGNFFKAWKEAVQKDCPEILLGHNGTYCWADSFTKNLGYGTSYMFCEDARFTDFGLDFHSADLITGGMEDIIRLGIYFRPQDSYGMQAKKPVIPRAGGFGGVNWNYFCVVGRRAYAYNQGKKLGGDKRAELLKLQIANMAAMGAKGVEFCVSPNISDVFFVNEADKVMEFVAEFEKMFFDGERLDDKRTEVYDLTVEPSPYHKIGPQGHFDQDNVYTPAKKYGFIQYKAHHLKQDRLVSLFNRDFYQAKAHRLKQDGLASLFKLDFYQTKVHRLKQDRLVSLFNWDFYQTKKLLIKIPDLVEGAYYVQVYTKEERYLLISCQEKESWSSEDLRKGISFDLEGGEIAGIYISEDKQAGYQDIRQDKAYSAAGKKPIDLYAWRDPIPSEPTIEFFRQRVFNPTLNQIRQKYPDVVPEKYLKRESH